MFLNRQRELALLQQWWDGGGAELITLYGRRQIGKTELLVQFLAGKPAIYFYADRQLVADHLRAFTDAVERHFQMDGPLYRRRTRELRLEPFTYREAALFFRPWTRVERALAWGIVGGVPSYLQALQGSDLPSAVRAHILDRSALL